MRPDRWAVLTVIAVVCLPILSACEGSPTTPAAEPAHFDGVWQIEYRITSCSGWRHCVLRVGKTQTILLTLSQTGKNVAGVITPIVGVGGGFHVDVNGTVNDAGEMTLAGSRQLSVGWDYPLEFGLTQFEARQMRQGGMTGTFAYTERGEPQGDFFGNALTTAEIVNAVREP
jgi:hypothetical protein